MSDVKTTAEEAFRKLQPEMDRLCPFGKPLEFRDLWPSEQEAFIREVSAILESSNAK